MARDPNVEILQDIIIRNLDTLGINMQADQIGSYTTGEPDGILGSGTALSLNTLVNMGQMASPEIINGEAFTNTYNADTVGYIADYMTLRGVAQEDIDSFVETATTSLVGTDLGTQYEGTTINTDRTADSLNAARATFEISRQATTDGTDPAEAVQAHIAAQQEARAAEPAVAVEAPTLIQPTADYTQADGTVYSNGRVATLQGVIIDNLDKLDIGLTAQQIGGADGQADDLMGGNTAAALQTIVYQAQLSSGVSADDVTLDINTQTHGLISTYLMNNGVSEEDTMLFIRQIPDLNGDLSGAYTQGANVDPNTLTVAAVAAADSDADISAQADELDGAEGLTDPAGDITGDEPGMETPTGTLTQAAYDALLEEDVLSLEEQYMKEAFPAARDAALQDAGMGEAQAQLDEAERFEAEEVDGLIQDARAEKSEVDGMLRAERTRFADQQITFDYEHDGETHTTRMSLNEINDKDGKGFLFFGDGDTDREQAAYDAGRVAFAEQLLQQVPEGQDEGATQTVAELQARSEELRGMIPRVEVHGPYNSVTIPGSIQADADRAIADAQAARDAIIADVDASSIVVATGEPVRIDDGTAPELEEIAEELEAVTAQAEERGSALDEAAALVAEIEAGLAAAEATGAELAAEQEERAASLAALSAEIDAELNGDAPQIVAFADELDGAPSLTDPAIMSSYDHAAGIGGEFDVAITRTEMPNAPVSYIPDSGMVTPTATMTHAGFLNLQDQDVLDIEQQYMVSAYSDAREQLLETAGLQEADARLTEARRFMAQDVNGKIQEEATRQAQVDGLIAAERERFAAEPMVFDYEYEGETITTRMSMNEIDEKDGGHILFWDGDSAQEQAAYDAGRAAFEQRVLERVPEGAETTVGELQAESEHLDGRILSGIREDAIIEVREASQAVADITARVDVAEIHVPTGEAVPVAEVEDLEAVRPVGFAEGISDVAPAVDTPATDPAVVAAEQVTDQQMVASLGAR